MFLIGKQHKKGQHLTIQSSMEIDLTASLHLSVTPLSQHFTSSIEVL